MSESDILEKTLLEKLRDLLERNPKKNDLLFSVGPDKKSVSALRIILEAASPVFAKELQEKWETAGITEGKGIPLPEYDPEAFELFVKLTTLDTWSVSVLKNLNLPPNQLLSLLSICRRFGLRSAIRNLNELTTAFMQSFTKYKATPDFFKLSQANLETILASEDLALKELEVFHCVVRWAEVQCTKKKLEMSQVNLRHVLGHSLFEIRFPTMSATDFSEAMKLKNILTPEEKLAIYEYIASKDQNFDTSQLFFKTKERKNLVASLPSTTMKWTKLDLTKDCKIVDSPPFVCNGSWKCNQLQSNEKIAVHGLGFLGPIHSDSVYDVTVNIWEFPSNKCVGKISKQILAQKGKTFHIIFEEPLTLQQCDLEDLDNYYQIFFLLKGPDTLAAQRNMMTETSLKAKCTQFKLSWRSNQMSEILFKTLW